MIDALLQFDYNYRRRFAIDGGLPLLCGVDEAGRGPLAGPVCCGAVILNPDNTIEGLNDSKKLTAKRREQLAAEIKEKALAWKTVFISEQTIDEINILQATMLGMQQAVNGLQLCPGRILVDGNRIPPKLCAPCEALIKGDGLSASVAAASILAKTERDTYMCQLAKQYPEFQLEKHKGYPTKLHYEMIKQYGVQPFHRKSFLKNLNTK